MTHTASQIRAIESTAADTLVIAGAGAGKTRVLTERIVHLLTKRGASGSEILALSFTRKAAAEVRERVEKAAEAHWGKAAAQQTAGLTLGTFHSVALQFLRADGGCLGYDGETLTVMDPYDAQLLLEQVADELGYRKGGKWTKGLSTKSAYKALERQYTAIHELFSESHELYLIIQGYWSRLFAMNALDFGMILRACRRMFASHPEILDRYRRRFKYVLVDELQDSDEVQYDLHDRFAGVTFFGVGDPRQTIYSFRQARPDLMTERHPAAELVNLQECFRCEDRIVEVANKLIAHNAEQVEPLIGATGRPGMVDWLAGRSGDVANLINHFLVNKNTPATDVAVLARSHRELARMASVCREAGIPVHHVGAGFDICDSPEWRWTYAALRLAVNPCDELAFWCCCDALGVEKVDRATIRAMALDSGRQLCDVAEFHLSGSAQKFFDVTWKFHIDTKGDDAVGAVYDDHITPFFPVLPEAVDAFWTRRYWSMPVASAVHAVAMRDQCDDSPDPRFGPKVTLSTVHAAKGLEWPVVIVINCNEKSFPSSQAVREDKIEEERRLMYVAMTRAIDTLVLHYRRAEDQNTERGVHAPSRFLSESGVL